MSATDQTKGEDSKKSTPTHSFNDVSNKAKDINAKIPQKLLKMAQAANAGGQSELNLLFNAMEEFVGNDILDKVRDNLGNDMTSSEKDRYIEKFSN